MFERGKLDKMIMRITVQKRKVVMLSETANMYKNSYYTDQYHDASVELFKMEEEAKRLHRLLGT